MVYTAVKGFLEQRTPSFFLSPCFKKETNKQRRKGKTNNKVKVNNIHPHILQTNSSIIISQIQNPKNSPSPSSILSRVLLMCKSKMDTQVVKPKPKSKPSPRTLRTPTSISSSSQSSSSKPLPSTTSSSSSSSTTHYNFSSTGTTTSSNYRNNYNNNSTTSSTISSKNSLSSLKDSLPETLHIYDFSEICTATNNFLSKRFSSSSSSACWRCTVRGKDVVIFQRKFRRSIEASHLHQRLSMICKSHHISLIKLLGASVAGDHIYLVYNYVNGSNLSNCLRNPRNPEYTVLSTWISRMQIATDLAQGLEYIHHYTGLNLFLVHNHIKSSSVLVTEPSFNAKICHFGTSELCGEIDHDLETTTKKIIGEIIEEEEEESSKLKRSDSGKMKFSGTRGYMSPEFQSTGIATQKSDVYAFGVVILELLSGEEPVRVKYDRESGEYRRVSVIETAREAVKGSSETEKEEGIGRIRRWVDRRLKDSFPVEVAEKITRLALDCVHVDEDKRPDMRRVAGKISRLYLQSKVWADQIRMPTAISVSLAPR